MVQSADSRNPRIRVGFCVIPSRWENDGMQLVYLDEVGETGAFVSHDDKRYNTSPVFGYAGFVIPEGSAREFSQRFVQAKRMLFKTEIEQAGNSSQWEKKGSEIFKESNILRYPQHLRVFAGLVGRLVSLGGSLFYYVDEKPMGTPKQTDLDPEAREYDAMRETANRLARHADSHGQNALIFMDQVNEKQRATRVQQMYAHMFSRGASHEEMVRLVEPPMHLDSKVSANVQFADWVAACVSAGANYQLVRNSRHGWIAESILPRKLHRAFTHESKLHFYNRALEDIVHSRLFSSRRPLFVPPQGQYVPDRDRLEKIHQIVAARQKRSGRV